jgi:copper chaperone CopZ
MNTDSKSQMVTATFDLDGATCMSCMYTIEHLGRKLLGVHDVYVNVKDRTIEVQYDAAKGRRALEEIPEIVRRIGYDARLRGPEQS